MSEPERGESPYMSVLRVWTALAWADGVIDPAEAEALRRLVAVAPIQPEERSTALGWLSARPASLDLETGYVSRLSQDSRRSIYQAAMRLAMVDRRVAAEERAMLDRLRDALRLDPAVAAELEKSVKI
jgi:uncharacterized membrane protein YebE (DUF533 family)